MLNDLDQQLLENNAEHIAQLEEQHKPYEKLRKGFKEVNGFDIDEGLLNKIVKALYITTHQIVHKATELSSDDWVNSINTVYPLVLMNFTEQQTFAFGVIAEVQPSPPPEEKTALTVEEQNLVVEHSDTIEYLESHYQTRQRIATAHEEAHGTAVSKVVFDDMCAGIFLSAYRLVQNLKEFNPNADKQMAGAYREVLDRFLRQTRGNDVNEIVKKQRRSKPSLCRITK